MSEHRIRTHPILPVEKRSGFEFLWQGRVMHAREGETIAAALFAGGVRVFGHHHKDGAPQGIFCANGQCSQCLVMADGLPVKACMTRVAPGMRVESLDGKPALPEMHSISTVEDECDQGGDACRDGGLRWQGMHQSDQAAV
jgi:sarcosine oxidase subunit alpha